MIDIQIRIEIEREPGRIDRILGGGGSFYLLKLGATRGRHKK